MKKLIIILLLYCAYPLLAMDSVSEYGHADHEMKRPLTDIEFLKLIGDPLEISDSLIQEKSTYGVLLALIRSHKQYKDFDPHIETVLQDYDISYFNQLEYDKKTKAFCVMTPEQKDIYKRLSKLAAKRNAYLYTNQLLDDILLKIKVEDTTDSESSFCAIL